VKRLVSEVKSNCNNMVTVIECVFIINKQFSNHGICNWISSRMIIVKYICYLSVC